MRDALRRFISDRHGRIAVAQVPNMPLVAWAAFALAGRFASDRWDPFFSFVAGASLVTWA